MAGEPRHLSGPLMLGIVALPIVFVWFLLRPGYSRSLRQAAFTYTVALPVLALVIYGAELLASL
jgi:hypothetical protein